MPPKAEQPQLFLEPSLVPDVEPAPFDPVAVAEASRKAAELRGDPLVDYQARQALGKDRTGEQFAAEANSTSDRAAIAAHIAQAHEHLRQTG